MLINLSELFVVEGKEKSYTLDLEATQLQVQDEVYPITDKNPVQIYLKNIGERTLYLEGNVQLDLDMFCNRCLDPVGQTFNLDFERTLDMKLTEEERQEALDEQPFLVGYQLDVDQLINNELLLNLPMKVLCNENCKGVCNRCGTNLNHENCDCDRRSLDPRMLVIQDIFKQSKEV